MGELKEDEHGTYKTDAGSTHPVDPEEVNYVPCNAVLRHTWDRYGERRYCTAMAVATFGGDANYEHPEFCKNHQDRAALMKQHEEEFTTGAYAKSHEHKFQHMPAFKQLLANDLYKSLLNESEYAEEWEAEEVELEIDVSDSDFAPDADEIVLDHPIPTEHRIRGKALWHAALDFVTMESIREEQFRVAAEESHEGRDLAVGERIEVITVTDDGQPIEDTAEHHLNLPLSRIQKDYERHLAFGGVHVEEEGESADMSGREWVIEVQPDDEEEMQPEAKKGDSSPLEDIEVPDEGGDS